MPTLRHAALPLALLLSACGGDPTPMGLDGGGVDRGLFQDGSDGQNVVAQTLALADSLFAFDPTLDPSATAEVNAAAIQANIETNLDTCGSANLSGTTVTVDFGAPPGCTLVNGVDASGSLTASVSSDGSSVTVALAFTDLVVDGVAVDGSSSFTATSSGSVLAVMLSVSSGDVAVSADLTVTGAAGSFTVSGTATLTEGGASVTLTLTDVLYASGDCYPSGGSVSMGRGRSTVIVTFSAATAATGEVTITEGRRTETATLPAYGDCPA